KTRRKGGFSNLTMQQNTLDIPIFYGTFADLTKLDLSLINGKIVLHKGRHFRECFKKLLHPDAFESSYKMNVNDFDNHPIYERDKVKRYAIVPLDCEKPLLEENWRHFHQMMLSLIPSDFALIEIIRLNLYNGRYQGVLKYSYNFEPSDEKIFGNFMFIAPQEYKFVRAYIKKYFYPSLNLKYIKYILSTYASSFKEPNPIYQYLGLIICLEVTIEGNEQLTYRLKRNTALLCGTKISECRRIYDNLNQLYKLRSAIIHGNINPSYKYFKDYHHYLKTLVARLIRELTVHNIADVAQLNKKLTELGYGQNRLISKNYSSAKYPILDNTQLAYIKIDNY
ncbi:MAG: hypothetical protein ABI378_08125, partial [Chitinophagaceae bacterium]